MPVRPPTLRHVRREPSCRSANISDVATRVVALALSASLACGTMAWGARSASAVTGARTASAQVALERAIERYDAARRRLSAIERSVEDRSARLDELLAEQDALASALSDRACEMYRQGRLGYLEVLAGSATFEQFLTTWAALVRIQQDDAETIASIRRARGRVAQTLATLLVEQESASRRLRALDSAKRDARRDLSDAKTEWAAYTQAIAERERAAREKAAAFAAATAGGDGSATAARGGSSSPSGASTPWKTATCSHYGTGSYGVHLASGVTIGPDSMIVAHKTLPFGTLVEFSYRGRTAVASVADRGPYYPGRVFDLGPGVARVLGFSGVDVVRYRVVR